MAWDPLWILASNVFPSLVILVASWIPVAIAAGLREASSAWIITSFLCSHAFTVLTLMLFRNAVFVDDSTTFTRYERLNIGLVSLFVSLSAMGMVWGAVGRYKRERESATRTGVLNVANYWAFSLVCCGLAYAVLCAEAGIL